MNAAAIRLCLRTILPHNVAAGNNVGKLSADSVFGNVKAVNVTIKFRSNDI